MDGWERCAGGVPISAGRGWFRCPSCRWVGWKAKVLPLMVPLHRRPVQDISEESFD